MPYFSDISRKRLETCDERLQKICLIAINTYDITVVSGFRGKEEQNICYAEGSSNLKFPLSYHNKYPSLAVDLAPWKNGGIDWEDEEEFIYLGGLIMGIATGLGIELTWGGRWQQLIDMPHFQLS